MNVDNYNNIFQSTDRVNDIFKQSNIMYDMLKAENRMADMFKQSNMMDDMLQNYNIVESAAGISSLIDSVNMFRNDDLIGLTTGIGNLIDSVNMFRNDDLIGLTTGISGLISSAIAPKHIDLLTQTSNLLLELDFKFSPLDKEFVEVYCKENEIDECIEKEIKIMAEQISSGKAELPTQLSQAQINVFKDYIYPIIVALFFHILQTITAQPTIVNNITYNENHYVNMVNNYYTIEQNMDVNILNGFYLMFVSKSEINVRKSADNSSIIVGKLTLGKVVQVVEKHKKWVKISWIEDSQYYTGWVQNWKLSNFQ